MSANGTEETELDAEASQHVRELSDTELAALTVDVYRRMAALDSQGIPIPLEQISNHYVVGLLEALVGPDEALRVREWHLTWMDKKFDMLEAALRMRMLGILDGGP